MFCSVIIPTIGRPTVKKAVRSVLDQPFSEAKVEVIVVNDSGRQLEFDDWVEDDRVTVIETHKRERNFARNSGAAVATGQYLLFLDDDDWILPGSLAEFYRLSQLQPGNAWLYGGILVVDETGGTLAEINSGLNNNCFAQILGGAWAPIQASIIKADAFFATGGFNPGISVTEDLDLCRKIALIGDFSNTPATVGCLLRGSSWNTSSNYRQAAEDTKISRDLILSEPRAFSRLVQSAGSAYWFGRVLKVYLSTVVLNLREKRLFAVISRVIYVFGVLLYAFRYLFARQFWAGVRADHVPGTLHFVMQAYEEKHRQAP